MIKASDIIETAKKAAKEVLDTAAVARMKLDTETHENIKAIKMDITEIKAMLDRKYVTQDQFYAVRLIAYGLVALFAASMATVIIYFIFRISPK